MDKIGQVGSSDDKGSGVFLFIFFLFAVAVGLLFWNQYRPRVILAKCSEAALTSSKTYDRSHLDSDPDIKMYDELLNECLQDFK